MTLSKRAKGTLWIIVAVIIGIPILLLLVVLLRLDSIVRMGVQVGGTRALGVETRLDSANVSLLGRSITLRGLNVANPKGFTGPTFVKADLISVSAEVGKLRKKEIHLYLVTLDGPEITYEVARPKTNVAVLMDNLKGNAEAPKPAGEKGEPVKLKIDRFTMSNAKVHVIVFGKSLDVSLGTHRDQQPGRRPRQRDPGGPGPLGGAGETRGQHQRQSERPPRRRHQRHSPRSREGSGRPSEKT